ncbi:hypothetical protein F5878DRAFT_646390 [Lentinula raphanica]|uniref:Uncharacterized protein n=1 Tax=Lentinula raphanica TaxID=153919 RepID=A0AA38U7A7_9AGAR|nr:hypothetical protein F5878DRAFT_646390 [Lentinula raphanica]
MSGFLFGDRPNLNGISSGVITNVPSMAGVNAAGTDASPNSNCSSTSMNAGSPSAGMHASSPSAGTNAGANSGNPSASTSVAAATDTNTINVDASNTILPSSHVKTSGAADRPLGEDASALPTNANSSVSSAHALVTNGNVNSPSDALLPSVHMTDSADLSVGADASGCSNNAIAKASSANVNDVPSSDTLPTNTNTSKPSVVTSPVNASSASTNTGTLSTNVATLPADVNASNSSANAPAVGTLSGSTGDNDQAIVVKKKRAEMGPAEKAAYRKASAARAEKLNTELEEFHQTQESMMNKIAEDNDISLQRVKRLVFHTAQSSKKKKASDHNVLVFIKSQEVNAGRAKGSREPLKRLHELVKEDEELQEMAEDSDTMAEFREQYDKHQEEKKLKSIRISKTAQARMVASKVNELQDNASFMAEAADVASFGLIVRGSFESTVTSSFWGHGPVDEFFRKTFNKGVQDVLDLFQAYVCTAEKMGTRKLYQSEMLAEIVRLIGQGLREITGISDLTMSYSKYDKLIVIPYKVRLLGWPEDVPFSYPHKLHADEIKTLFDSLSNGTTHWQRMAAFEHRHYINELEKAGKLDPQQRPQRSDAGKSHKKRRADMISDDDDSDDQPRPSKKTKTTHTTKSRRKGANDSAGKKGESSKKTSREKEKTLTKRTKGRSKKTGKSTKGKGKAGAKGKSKATVMDSDEDDAEFSASASTSDSEHLLSDDDN